MNPGDDPVRLNIESADELYNYLTLNRALNDKFICNVWSDHKEYIIESKSDQKKFDVIPISWYDRSDARKVNNLSWFPYLKFPLMVI